MNKGDLKYSNFSLNKALKEGFSGFGHWWYLFCAMALVIMFFESYLPKILISWFSKADYIKHYFLAFRQFEKELFSISQAANAFIDFKMAIIDITESAGQNIDFYLILIKVGIVFVLLLFILCLLYIVTILISKYSIWKNKSNVHIKRSMKKSPIISLSYFLLSVLKVLPFSLSFLIIPAYLVIRVVIAPLPSPEEIVQIDISKSLLFIAETIGFILIFFIALILSTYFYIRLYFTGFIITEESANPFKAIKVSWQMTNKQSKKIFIIFIITLIIDIVSAITVIGVIPGTGIKYTIRASVYKQIVGEL